MDVRPGQFRAGGGRQGGPRAQPHEPLHAARGPAGYLRRARLAHDSLPDGYPRRVHPDRRLLGWGLFFVLLGAVPLAVQSGAIPRETVAQSWRLWPLILIGGGIGVLLQGTRAAVVGGLVVALTFGIIGGSVLAGGIDIGAVGCGGGPPSGTTFENGGNLDAQASVDIDGRSRASPIPTTYPTCRRRIPR